MEHKRLAKGMIIARGYPSNMTLEERIEEIGEENLYPDICPVWGDKLPYKSNTVVCKQSEEGAVTFWLEYVLGSDCIRARKLLHNNTVAIRADYMCW